MNQFKYSFDNKRYHTYNYHLKTKFNQKVAKISIDGGFTCPNRDGKLGTYGCLYCSERGSGDFAGNPNLSITNQFDEVKKVMDKKWDNLKYIIYFQAFSGTYDDVTSLSKKYHEALELPNVIGLNIATRCDCINEEVIDLLTDINKRTYLTVELGLQTIHAESMIKMNLGYTLKTFTDTVKKLRAKNINVVVHIINGLPGETKAMMVDTVKYLNTLDIQGLKIHMLHIIKNTPLANIYQKEPFPLLDLHDYVDVVCSQLCYLDEEIVIHRVTGDAKKEDLIAPLWTLKKTIVTNEIDKQMAKLNIYQGIKKGK